MLTWHRKERLSSRAITGWGIFILEEMLDLECFWDSESAPGFIIVGFHIIDLGVHLFPCLLMLQLGAKFVTVPVVFGSYALTRMWFMWATTHHYSLNWPLLCQYGRVGLKPYILLPLLPYMDI